jgi:hypothetical protein
LFHPENFIFHFSFSFLGGVGLNALLQGRVDCNVPNNSNKENQEQVEKQVKNKSKTSQHEAKQASRKQNK